MPAGHLITGARGEDIAEEHLKALGLRIRHRNWQNQGLELDMVCLDPSTRPATLVFVEVKTRSGTDWGAPSQAVGRGKRGRLDRAARLYLSEHKLWDAPCRFDVVCVTKHGDAYTVEHLPNAFDSPRPLRGGDTSWQPW